jgi:bacteriocin-like protein
MKNLDIHELAQVSGAGSWFTEKCYGYETDSGVCIGLHDDLK